MRRDHSQVIDTTIDTTTGRAARARTANTARGANEDWVSER
ncbi:hypothetical protein [Streptosporangium sp. DT93]